MNKPRFNSGTRGEHLCMCKFCNTPPSPDPPRGGGVPRRKLSSWTVREFPRPLSIQIPFVGATKGEKRAGRGRREKAVGGRQWGLRQEACSQSPGLRSLLGRFNLVAAPSIHVGVPSWVAAAPAAPDLITAPLRPESSCLAAAILVTPPHNNNPCGFDRAVSHITAFHDGSVIGWRALSLGQTPPLHYAKKCDEIDSIGRSCSFVLYNCH